MVEVGYALSSEERPRRELVRDAQAAEAAVCTCALVSDHVHPWIGPPVTESIRLVGYRRHRASDEPAAAWGFGSSAPVRQLPLARHCEQASQTVRQEDIASAIICGPDPERHRAAIQEFGDAGVNHVYVHQVGKDQAVR